MHCSSATPFPALPRIDVIGDFFELTTATEYSVIFRASVAKRYTSGILRLRSVQALAPVRHFCLLPFAKKVPSHFLIIH